MRCEMGNPRRSSAMDTSAAGLRLNGDVAIEPREVRQDAYSDPGDARRAMLTTARR